MPPLLLVHDLCVEFRHETRGNVRALNGLSLRVRAGEIVGILGESGCGKSTLANSILRLLPQSATIARGKIELEGRSLLGMSKRELARLRGETLSLIPQNPGLALNPFLKVGKQVAEILRVHKRWTWVQCCEEAEKLLDLVNLRGTDRRIFDAYPHQLSGGQQQRVTIAQAICCHPSLVIADEPTASLDSHIEAEILELLRELRSRFEMSLILITHNPTILDGLADRIAVMYAGRVVEEGAAAGILHNPRHPYTRALLSCGHSKRVSKPIGRGTRLPTIPGATPDGTRRSKGCAFAERCVSRFEQCTEQAPAKTEQPNSGVVECLLYES